MTRMDLIRPEARATLWRWREVAAAGALALLGAWFILLGGFILIPAGVLLLALAAGLGLLALRRLRFAQGGEAPGVVELDEGQVGYFGPGTGGFVSLRELDEVRLITLRGQRLWRLKQSDGQALLIPVAAQGAERLFDAFAALPGMDTQALVAALAPETSPSGKGLTVATEMRVIWRRAARPALT
ncbi:hypothetical protein RNZ50_19200 [Paracoccaceae bacterium Fryx2]|nr:hypothetical protein [Paracoccaceae bacterium Fryx2]